MSNDKLAATGYEPSQETICDGHKEQYFMSGYEAGKKDGPSVGIEQDPGYGVKEAWQPQARPEQDVADLGIDEWVGQALGAASSCWSDLEGAGVFDSTRCAAIADALNKHIAGLCVALVEEGQQRLRIQERYLHSLYEGTVTHGCAWCGETFGAGKDAETKARAHVKDNHAQPCEHEVAVE